MSLEPLMNSKEIDSTFSALQSYTQSVQSVPNVVNYNQEPNQLHPAYHSPTDSNNGNANGSNNNTNNANNNSNNGNSGVIIKSSSSDNNSPNSLMSTSLMAINSLNNVERPLSASLNLDLNPTIHNPMTNGNTNNGSTTNLNSGLNSNQNINTSLTKISNSNLNNINNINNSPQTHHRTRVNRPGQRFGAKKKSWVWNWFVQDPENPNIATCDECLKLIARLPSDKGSPKKLCEHLKTHKITKESMNPRRTVVNTGDFSNTLINNLTNNNLNNLNNTNNNLNNSSNNNLNSLSNNNNNNLNLNNNNNNNNNNNILSHQNSNIINNSNSYNGPLSLGTTSNGNTVIDSKEFDNTEYTQMKFHKNIMKFLTENRLPIQIVKTQSFRQLIYTLRPDSVLDLNELNNLYSSLLQQHSPK
ncbi:uncharacterized protein ASCRUDRAFT_85929 [Ascoidea rubescens DSM 1968]|uniref:BED-type domain-containing protein n=1 Tax=Ascoidea rubescens DSM 1968 TaxID=1344418 RepID=A0A1D2VJK0_9ASCO|nr:hypothetical protein ASCRUDRAFT_85929 [Ascoidea rubescens DSM 1968]ODV61687.1 hypothetical protein ASCRUDRAFT_85929 [Ascoidea rubescens DSM 1968]